jgi:hypothetical protein
MPLTTNPISIPEPSNTYSNVQTGLRVNSFLRGGVLVRQLILELTPYRYLTLAPNIGKLDMLPAARKSYMFDLVSPGIASALATAIQAAMDAYLATQTLPADPGFDQVCYSLSCAPRVLGWTPGTNQPVTASARVGWQRYKTVSGITTLSSIGVLTSPANGGQYTDVFAAAASDANLAAALGAVWAAVQAFISANPIGGV